MLAAGALGKDSSTEELALLVAEFALLEEQLELLAGAAEAATLSLVGGDDLLEKLAEEIPDMRARVGVGCAPCAVALHMCVCATPGATCRGSCTPASRRMLCSCVAAASMQTALQPVPLPVLAVAAGPGGSGRLCPCLCCLWLLVLEAVDDEDVDGRNVAHHVTSHRAAD